MSSSLMAGPERKEALELETDEEDRSDSVLYSDTSRRYCPSSATGLGQLFGLSKGSMEISDIIDAVGKCKDTQRD